MPRIVPLPKACILPGFLPASSPRKTSQGLAGERGVAFIAQSCDVGFTTVKGTEVLAVPLPVTLGERGQNVSELGRGKHGGDNAKEVKFHE